jgi:hypothetical protein
MVTISLLNRAGIDPRKADQGRKNLDGMDTMAVKGF